MQLATVMTIADHPGGTTTKWDGPLLWITLPVLLFPSIVLLQATVLFALGVAIGPWSAPLAMVATLALLIGLGGREVGYPLAAMKSLIAPAIIVLCGAVAALFYDFSGDGQEYHQPAVLALARGWNPFVAHHLEDWSQQWAASVTGELFVDHYTKGAWIVAAAIYSSTGWFEAAKLFNLAYPIACFCAAASFLAGFDRWPKGFRYLVSALIAANPVTIYQLPSYFVDGQVAALSTIVIIAALGYRYHGGIAWLLVFNLAGLILINVKFTGLVYFGVVAAILAVMLWSTRRDIRRYVVTTAITATLGIGLIGYQPYVTNLVEHRNPFYPVIDHPKGGNITVGHAAPAFRERNRFEKLARSLFSHSGNSYEGVLPGPKIPFLVRKEEMYIFSTTNVGLGGFGPLFSGALVLSVVGALALMWAKGDRTASRIGGSILLFALASASINPEMWWARYAPQIWLLPFAALLPMHAQGHLWSRTAAWVLAAVLLANLGAIATYNWTINLTKAGQFRQSLTELRRLGTEGSLEVTFPREFELSYRQRFEEAGIRFRAAAPARCARPGRVGYPTDNQVLYCLGR